MKLKLKLIAGLVTALLAVTGPARAEITAQEVLAEWRALAANAGQTLVIGSEELVGDTLVLSNFGSNATFPSATVSALVDWIKLRETGGGSVEITMAPTSNIQIDVTADKNMPVDISVLAEQVGLTILVSGTPDNMTFSFAMDSYDISLEKISLAQLLVDGTFQIHLQDLTGDYALTRLTGDRAHIKGQYDLGKLDMNLDFKIPGTTGFVKGSVHSRDVGFSGNGDIISASVIQEMINAGKNPLRDISANYSGSASEISYSFDGEIEGSQAAVSGSVESVSGALEASSQAIAYGFSYLGGAVNFFSSETPFPEVRAQFDEISFDTKVPLAQSDTPLDASLLIALRGIVVNDAIWGVFDPAVTLPRDPFSAVIDLTGTVNILVNLMDLAEATNSDGLPIAPQTLTLNELLVSFGGAVLEGDGDFFFDNDNLALFGGFPQPIGQVNLSLKGGFGLLDKLTALRLLPQEVSVGARGMIGVFASPGDEPDHFTSVIKMTPNGSIMANGQRIK